MAPASAHDVSQSATAFDAHGWPSRRTISGTCSLAKLSTRSSASAAATVGEDGSPGTRAPDRGSARTGQPKLAARRRMVSGRPAPAPAMIKPFAAGRKRPAKASSEPGPSTLRTGSTRCHGRPLRRPGGSSPGVASSGSRKARFACTGPGPIGPAVASATRRLASERQVDRARSSGTPGSTDHRRAPPNNPVCSMVCGAPK